MLVDLVATDEVFLPTWALRMPTLLPGWSGGMKARTTRAMRNAFMSDDRVAPYTLAQHCKGQTRQTTPYNTVRPPAKWPSTSTASKRTGPSTLCFECSQ